MLSSIMKRVEQPIIPNPVAWLLFEKVWEYGGVGVWGKNPSHTPILPHTHTSTMLPDLVLGDAFNGLAQHLEAHAFDKGFVAGLRALLE